MNAHVYAVGSLVAPVSAFYYLNAQGECRSGSAPPPNVITYSIGSELPAGTFVQGTLGAAP